MGLKTNPDEKDAYALIVGISTYEEAVQQFKIGTLWQRKWKKCQVIAGQKPCASLK